MTEFQTIVGSVELSPRRYWTSTILFTYLRTDSLTRVKGTYSAGVVIDGDGPRKSYSGSGSIVNCALYSSDNWLRLAGAD